ncbi:hypothetical protein [Methylomonas sp. AM2-LC]|jgi:hypothetical protein|uniref:hypothetical protein n=1 Tax=Methylomonas sp. AM2-LC TaxID=3153301 RepID=UPI003267EC30
MQISFVGLAREHYTHSYDCNNMSWGSGVNANGIVNNLKLNGDYKIKFKFDENDFKCWSKEIVKSNPEFALRIAGEMQTEAIINIAKTKSKPSFNFANPKR